MARHQECANQLYDGLKKMGLEPFVEDKVNFLFNPFIPVTTRFFQVIWYDLSDQRLVRKYFKCCLELSPQLLLNYINCEFWLYSRNKPWIQERFEGELLVGI